MQRTMPWNETTRKQYTRISRRYGSDLTDAEWEVLAPLLPPLSRRGRPVGSICGRS